MKTYSKYGYFKLFSQKNWFFLSVSALLIIFNCLLLIRLGIGILLQLYSLLMATLLTLSGLVLLSKKKHINDSVLRLIAAFLVGAAAFTAFNFVLLHINDPVLTQVANVSFFIFFLIVATFRNKKLFSSRFQAAVSGKNIALIFLVALILSFATAYGFRNNPRGRDSRSRISSWSFIFSPEMNLRNWGWNKDKVWYLVGSPQKLISRGLPGENFHTPGVEIFWLSLDIQRPGFQFLNPAKMYKALSLLFFFCLLYPFAFIATRFFALGPIPTAITILAIPFFGAINYPLFNLGKSSYVGFFSAGTTLYHSLTQMMGMMMGVGAVALLLLAVTERQPTFVLGCCLISVSFFFKPSVFTILAPGVVILFFFYQKVRITSRVISVLILLIPPLFWQLYPAWYNIPSTKTPIAFQPFATLFHYAARRLPSAIRDQPLIMGTFITICSFAVLLPIILDRLLNRGKSSKKTCRGLLQAARDRVPEIFLTLPLLIGVLSYALLIEDGPRMVHANLAWGAATGYLFFLPFLIKLVFSIQNCILRGLAYLLLGLHFWGGIYHLYRFATMGKII